MGACGVEPIGDIVPVPQIPDRVEVIGLPVLVLKVEGVFPCVVHERGSGPPGQDWWS